MNTQLIMILNLLHFFMCSAVTTDNSEFDCLKTIQSLKDETCKIKDEIKDLNIKSIQQDGKFIKQDNDILMMQNEQYKLQCIFNDTLEKEMESKLKQVNSNMDKLAQNMTEIHLSFTDELQRHETSQESEIERIESEISAVERQLQGQIAVTEELQGQNTNQESEIERIKSENREVERQLQRQIVLTELHHDGFTKELQRQKTNHESKIERIKSENRAVEQQLQNHESEIERIKSENRAVEQQLQNHESEIKRIKSENRAVERQLQRHIAMTGKKVYTDCQDVRNHGKHFSGVYTVHPYGEDIDLFCYMDTEGHGYMVFHHRYDGSVDFYRPWSDYKNGFGDLSKEHWLGNEILHSITSQRSYELRIDLEDFEGNQRYAVYNDFSIGDESSNYILSIGTYNGTAGDALSGHKNQMFSTKDRDNDVATNSCAVHYSGAWWYRKCFDSNLNGLYTNKKNTAGKFNKWWHWPGGETNMKRTLMMIRTQ